jgi:hypothetical protein
MSADRNHPIVKEYLSERNGKAAKASAAKYKGTAFAKQRAQTAIQERWRIYRANLVALYGNDALRREGERKHGYFKRLRALIESYDR